MHTFLCLSQLPNTDTQTCIRTRAHSCTHSHRHVDTYHTPTPTCTGIHTQTFRFPRCLSACLQLLLLQGAWNASDHAPFLSSRPSFSGIDFRRTGTVCSRSQVHRSHHPGAGRRLRHDNRGNGECCRQHPQWGRPAEPQWHPLTFCELQGPGAGQGCGPRGRELCICPWARPERGGAPGQQGLRQQPVVLGAGETRVFFIRFNVPNGFVSEVPHCSRDLEVTGTASSFTAVGTSLRAGRCAESAFQGREGQGRGAGLQHLPAAAPPKGPNPLSKRVFSPCLYKQSFAHVMSEPGHLYGAGSQGSMLGRASAPNRGRGGGCKVPSSIRLVPSGTLLCRS